MSEEIDWTRKVRSIDCYMDFVFHFNQPLIVGAEVRRLIGYAETGIDNYLITKRMGGEVRWPTCVGGYVFLDKLNTRGWINQDDTVWDDYRRLDEMLTLNNCPRQTERMIELRHDDMERG